MDDEQELVSDVHAEAECDFDFGEIAKPEAEAGRGEDSTEKYREESHISAAVQRRACEQDCPILMGYRNSTMRCGRRLHIAPAGVDEIEVCLMHSKDPNKQTGVLFRDFMSEFERILEYAGEGEAHFERFVFPKFDCAWRVFEAFCMFTEACFTQNVDFRFATFTKEANFYRASFSREADFLHTSFTMDAIFYEANIAENINFKKAYFMRGATFRSTIFGKYAGFKGAIFTQNVDFSKAQFANNGDFNEATFDGYAFFSEAVFAQRADFSTAMFAQGSDFCNAIFSQSAIFTNAQFHGTADWQGSQFFDRAEFRQTSFLPQDVVQPSAVFSLASFYKPSEIIFDNVDLSRAIFHNRDISQVLFTPSVRWGTRDRNRGLRVFEETVSLQSTYGKKLQKGEQRDYRAVAQIYRQLKKNYDSRLDYWTANEFHIGEMEMKRFAGPTGKFVPGVRQWLHQKLSLTAMYRYASDYGNSYWRPVVWLISILFFVAILLPFPDVGLKRQGALQKETYFSAWRTGDSLNTNLWSEARLVGKSILTSVDIATFQKSVEYMPAYPWGRVLAIFETLFTSSLFALFLLAIRRQYRR